MLNTKILELFQRSEVSDLHIKEGGPIWCRDAGVMTPADNDIVTKDHILGWLTSIKEDSGVNVEYLQQHLSEKGDLDFSAQLPGMGIRGNVYRSSRKLTLALRRLSSNIPDMDRLGLPNAVSELITRSKGIMLVTGATGSGKSTTLAGILEHLNQTVSRHMITIEDPIEFVMKDAKCRIDQRQIGRDATSFPLALRAALRQDPDILLIGEMRDQETVKTALDAANTGHLVFATLHTLNARQSIERMTSFFAADEKEWAQGVISSVLLGVMSQVLVPKITGPGRVLCSELMVNTSAVSQNIRDNKLTHLVNAMDTGSSEGHQTLNADLMRKVQEGTISTEDALYFSYNPMQLQKDMSDDY